MLIIIFRTTQIACNNKLTLSPRGCQCPPTLGEIKEVIVQGPMLLYISWTYLECFLTQIFLSIKFFFAPKISDLKGPVSGFVGCQR